MVVAILAIILTLFLVIGLHEAGHALVARLFNIKIKRIAIGFGKPIIQWRSHKGCEWVLGIWLLGGYVQLANTRISAVDPKEFDTCFDKKPIWQRVLVLIAGVSCNLIVAWFALMIVFYGGIQYKMVQVGHVAPQSRAAQGGISAGDQIIDLKGQPIFSWQEVGQELVIAWGQSTVPVVVNTASGRYKKAYLDLSQVRLSNTKNSLLLSLGITPDVDAPMRTIKASSLIDANRCALRTMTHMLYFFLMVLKHVFSGVLSFSLLLGPIGLFAASIASFSQGVAVFSYYIASLSTAVALVNLFPIPGLDGGGLVYALLEKIRKKPVSIALELLIYRLVLIVLFLLLVQLMKNDLLHWLVR